MQLVIFSFLIALFLCPSQGAEAIPEGPQAFNCSGKNIAVEWFVPASAKDANTKRATVIILHGSGGLDKTGGFFRDLATDSARHGRNAMIVHYLDQNDLTSASSADMAHNFKLWLKTTTAAINYASKQDSVDVQNIALLGHSLGAQLALHTGAADKRVSAVIDMGGSFVLPTAKISRMPPVLVLHGARDKVVPLSREKSLIAVLERINSKFEEHIFAGADHAFNHVDFNKLSDLYNDFLDRHQR